MAKEPISEKQILNWMNENKEMVDAFVKYWQHQNPNDDDQIEEPVVEKSKKRTVISISPNLVSRRSGFRTSDKVNQCYEIKGVVAFEFKYMIKIFEFFVTGGNEFVYDPFLNMATKGFCLRQLLPPSHTIIDVFFFETKEELHRFLEMAKQHENYKLSIPYDSNLQTNFEIVKDFLNIEELFFYSGIIAKKSKIQLPNQTPAESSASKIILAQPSVKETPIHFCFRCNTAYMIVESFGFVDCVKPGHGHVLCSSCMEFYERDTPLIDLCFKKIELSEDLSMKKSTCHVCMESVSEST